MKQYVFQGVVILIAVYFAFSMSPLSSIFLGIPFFNSTTSNTYFDVNNKQSYNWKIINIKNAIATFTTKLVGSRLLGVKGVAIFDMHISDTMAPFVNISMSFEWIDLLGNIKAYPYLTRVASPASQLSSLHRGSHQENSISKTSPGLQNSKSKKQVFVDHVKRFFAHLFRLGRHREKSESTSTPVVNIESSLDDESVMKLQDGYELVDIIHQELSLPWPISPRDILLYREFSFQRTDPRSKNANKLETELDSVTVNYHSIEDGRVPQQKGFIRSFSPHVLWRFKALPPGHDAIPELLKTGITVEALSEQVRSTYPSSDEGLVTRMIESAQEKRRNIPGGTIGSDRVAHHRTIVEVECIVDSKGAIPAWFINFIQMNWPHKTLSKFRFLAQNKRSKAYIKVRDW